VQAVTEEAVLRLARTARALTGERYLCLAGGVALNCVANGKLVRAGVFDDVWIQPAAGDAGGALGAALAVAYAEGKPRREPGKRDGMQGAYLGPSYGRDEIKQALDARGAKYEELPLEGAIDATAEALAQEKIVGWFHGRMEFGPRSLGSRSILADARSPRMQSVLNLRIKYRESFRPFAPAVLRDQVDEYFELERDSPYMLLVAPVRVDRRRAMADDERAATGLARLRQVRSDIPAVTHVDYSARVQTVHEDTNPRFHQLLKSFRGKTGYGVLVNTSFNIRDEPIVCSPDDAYRCFMGTEMDLLVLETFVLRKERQ
jgi:carbamoyltransferase